MESGKIENGLNKGLWRVMESNFRDVSEVPTMKSIEITPHPYKRKNGNKEPLYLDDDSDDDTVGTIEGLDDFLDGFKINK